MWYSSNFEVKITITTCLNNASRWRHEARFIEHKKAIPMTRSASNKDVRSLVCLAASLQTADRFHASLPSINNYPFILPLLDFPPHTYTDLCISSNAVQCPTANYIHFDCHLEQFTPQLHAHPRPHFPPPQTPLSLGGFYPRDNTLYTLANCAKCFNTVQ